MINLEDMRIAQVEFDFADGIPGKTQYGNKDWDLAQEHATFSHKDACEFMFYIADEESIDNLKSEGFSEELVKVCDHARKSGYNYICLYS